jgi:hypothetical protein
MWSYAIEAVVVFAAVVTFRVLVSATEVALKPPSESL